MQLVYFIASLPTNQKGFGLLLWTAAACWRLGAAIEGDLKKSEGSPRTGQGVRMAPRYFWPMRFFKGLKRSVGAAERVNAEG